MTKNCVNCGNPFESCRDSNIFCSKKCNNNSRSKKVIKEISEEIAGEENIFQESKEREIKTNDVLHNVPDDIAGWKTRAFSTNKDGEVVTTWRRKQEEEINVDDFKDVIKKALTDIEPFTYIVKPQSKTIKSQIFWISDIHAGMCNKLPILGHKWTVEKLYERILSIANFVQNCDELIIVNLGDSIDGLFGVTTRGIKGGGHDLEQSLDNSEQMLTIFKAFQKLFIILIELHKSGVFNKLRFVSVGTSNHGGKMERILGMFISEWLKAKLPFAETQVSELFIDYFKTHDHTFVFTHGRDDKHQKFSFPLILNAITENYFREIFDNFGIAADNKTHVISGHCHQELYTAKKWSYEKVLALSSGSDYGQSNYGYQASGVSYTEIMDNGFIKRSSIIFEN